MKKEINASSARSKINKGSAFFWPLIAAMIGCLAQPAQASVQATLFDPPLKINAWTDASSDVLLDVLATDFNADGKVDFRLLQGIGGIEAYFNGPTRIAKRTLPGTFDTIGGPVAAVPLNSSIGTNIVSPGTNIFAWSPGYANVDDLTQQLGDHEATVFSANIAIPLQPGPIIIFSTNGTPVTNVYYPGPLTFGDVPGREAVMAVEFNVNGEVHYGYLHFDFREGAGGVIYGWAYETEPNVAIKAKPLSTNKTRLHLKHPRIVVVPGRIPGSAGQ